MQLEFNESDKPNECHSCRFGRRTGTDPVSNGIYSCLLVDVRAVCPIVIDRELGERKAARNELHVDTIRMVSVNLRYIGLIRAVLKDVSLLHDAATSAPPKYRHLDKLTQEECQELSRLYNEYVCPDPFQEYTPITSTEPPLTLKRLVLGLLRHLEVACTFDETVESKNVW